MAVFFRYDGESAHNKCVDGSGRCGEVKSVPHRVNSRDENDDERNCIFLMFLEPLLDLQQQN